MSHFAGHWKVDEVHARDASGRCTPQAGSEVWISDGESQQGPCYIFSFLPKTAAAATDRVFFVAAKDDGEPDRLLMDPPSGIGYSLQADYWTRPVVELVVTIQYGHRGGSEDNDTATFTATKTSWPERPE